MKSLSDAYIRDTLADSSMIFDRGRQTFTNGSYFLSGRDEANKTFTYEFNGSFGNYTTRIRFTESDIDASCTCPYPGKGCRHAVAAALNARDILLKPRVQTELFADTQDPYLNESEIRAQALQDRTDRAGSESFSPVRGDMFTGDHKVISGGRHTYTVCFHDPEKAMGHCSCPDYLTNGLGTCKHIIFMAAYLKSEPGFKARVKTEHLPFIDIFWDSIGNVPRLYAAKALGRPLDLAPALDKYFDASGNYTGQDISLIMGLMLRLHGDRRVRIRDSLLRRVDHRLQALQLKKMDGRPRPPVRLKRPLYPFQRQGVEFCILKTGALIGDEMGLGKTAQAIAAALIKCETFGFSNILVITLSALKQKWKDEIQNLSEETSVVVEGPPARRNILYSGKERFKICHYEQVIKDSAAISRMNPDIIILDEAQRIRDISTRTAEAVKRLPKKHAIVLTGIPLETKPEDLYSIVQFLDPYRLTPLWQFSADHYLIPRDHPDQVAGYKHLDRLKQKLADMLIRRTWKEVRDQLPPAVTSTYLIPMAKTQSGQHRSLAARLADHLNKKIFTDMDMEQIRNQVLRMRMVSNSTYLLDRDTQVSPKLKELAAIINEVAVQNRRKMVIFSEWTAMTFLVARHLSEAGTGFVEVSGKIQDSLRHQHAKKFAADPDIAVFLTTDAGSRGLDLSAADCMVNVELPWTPAQAARRCAKLVPPAACTTHQPSPCHTINLLAEHSIEPAIQRGLTTDPDLFSCLFGQTKEPAAIPEPDRQDMADRLKGLLAPDVLPISRMESVSLPDETPFFIFPEAMPMADLSGENTGTKHSAPTTNTALTNPAQIDSEQLEKTLNAGLEFMAGLAAMAAGQKSQALTDKQITIDGHTGRITLSFTLPPGPSNEDR